MSEVNNDTKNKLPNSILNYFAAFTETKFNFRTLINYKWTNDELTLDLSLFQKFQDNLIDKIKDGNSTPITICSGDEIIKLSVQDVQSEIENALTGKFNIEYLKSCVEQEKEKLKERATVFICSEKEANVTVSAENNEEEIEKQNKKAFLNGCRKFNLALRKQIEIIITGLQEDKLGKLKEELGITNIPSSIFNSTNFLQNHFNALKIIAGDCDTEEQFFENTKKHFKDNIEEIILYDLFFNLQRYARYNSTGTLYFFFHELNRQNESYPIFFVEVNLSLGNTEITISFIRDLVLINTPAINYFKFPSILTTSRSSIFKNASNHLSGTEVFLQSQYGWSEPFILESKFKQIKAPEDIFPDIKCRVGFQVVRNEDKKLLDYSEIMTNILSGNDSKFSGFISDYIEGNVENTQDTVDKEFKEKYPPKSSKRFISDNPLSLNDSQKRILLALNKPKNKILVVDGPPGTGKSHTIAALTYWANQEKRSVVITSHKKQALDVIDSMLTEKFRNLHPNAKPSIVRIGKTSGSMNTLENTLQNAVINAAGNRSNNFNIDAVEKDLNAFQSKTLNKIDQHLSYADHYVQNIEDLFKYEQIQNELKMLGLFSDQDLNLSKVPDSVNISFNSIENFATEYGLSSLKGMDLSELNFLLKRREDIPVFLTACEALNLCDDKYLDLDLEISHIPESFLELIGKASKVFKKNIPIKSLHQDDIPAGMIKKMFRRAPNKKECEDLIKTLNSLKYAEILNGIAKIKDQQINELNLNTLLSGVEDLDTLISLKKHQDVINEYKSINTNKEKSITDIFKMLTDVKDLLKVINVDLLNSIIDFFNFYDTILAKLQIVKDDLYSLSRIKNLTENESKIFQWIRLHYSLSKCSSIELINNRDLEAINLLKQKKVEHKNDVRLKNLNNFLGDVAKIKVSFNGGKRFSIEQTRVLLDNISAIIAEPNMISKYFPMEENVIDLLVIDEASQVSIANSISLILRAKQVVVFGDEYQYGAVSAINVSSKYSSSYFREIINAYRDDYNVVASEQETQELINEVSKEILDEDLEVERVIRPQDYEGTILWLKTFNIRTSTLTFAKAIANYTTSLCEHYRSFSEIIDYSNEFFYKPAQLELTPNRIRTKPIIEVLCFLKVETKGDSGQNVNLDEIDAVINDIQKRTEHGFKGTIGIITSFREQQARMEQALNEKLNMPELKRSHKLTVWFVGDVQGEERDLIYYSFVEDRQYKHTSLRSIYPVIDGTADNIRSLKMQRLNVGFSRAKDTMVFVHSMPTSSYSNTRLGDALKHYDKILTEYSKNDLFVEDTSVFESPAEEELYKTLIETNFVKENRENIRVIPQFKIGEYIKAEYRAQIPKYRVDFLLTFSEGGKEIPLILEYDGVEYHTKNPDIVTGHNFSQQYLDYDINRQLELESYGYRFLRLNKFNLRPENQDETKVDVLNRFLRKTLME